MQQGIIAVVFFGNGLVFLQELQKYIVVMISQSNNKGAPPKTIVGELNSLVDDHSDRI